MSSGSSFGNHILPEAADNVSRTLVSKTLNADLQWSEGSYRGFFTLTIDTNKVNATFWAMRNTSASPHCRRARHHPPFTNGERLKSCD